VLEVTIDIEEALVKE